MARTIVHRVLQAIPVVIGISFLTFCLLNLLPGDTATAILGPNATRQSLAVLRKQLGLDKSFWTRYGDWVGNILSGHLGSSLVTNQPISSILAIRLPVTAELVVLATFLALIAAVPVALLAAYRPHSVVDRLSIVVSMSGLSVPSFVIALVLILVFAVHLGVLPASGYKPLGSGLWQNVRTMILPSVTIGIGLFCSYTRILRADLIDQMASEEYIRVARGKGLSKRQVLLRHALRNALFPLTTVVGLNFGTLLGLTVLVETVFALPGIGALLITSILTKDVPVVQILVVLTSIVVVLANLVTDLLYGVLDPRVRHGARRS
jgi:peptide/nickel transport system permease protein